MRVSARSLVAATPSLLGSAGVRARLAARRRSGGHAGAPKQGACSAVYRSSKRTVFQIMETRSDASVEDYLSNRERIVNVTFPDGKRRQRIEESGAAGAGETASSRWRVTLLQQNFLGIAFTPKCELTVRGGRGTHDDPAATLHIDVGALDLSDLPRELQVPAEVHVSGWLRPQPAPRGAGQRSGGVRLMRGEVAISLDVDVPMPFAAAPGLAEAIEAILMGIVGRLEGSLKLGLPRDYRDWALELAEGKVRANS